MPHKFDPVRAARLDSPERLALLPVDRAVELARVGSGERVLDVGCGTGVFTVALARAVGAGGRVVALDLLPEMVAACRARVDRESLANVEVEKSEESLIPRPAASVDCVFASHLLHELEDPDAFLAEVRRVLVPGGRLVAIEWEKVETPSGPPLEHRLTPAEARALLERHGFAVVEQHALSWANYLLVARREPRHPSEKP